MRFPIGRRFLAVSSLIGVLFAGLPGGTATASHDAAAECPPVMPVSEVTKGMIGTGYTVVKGREPVPFNVEILGVLPDGVGPGRDMIIINTSGPTIEQNGGGIWFGMSGSPVYVNGKLVGAVAFGLTFGPSSIGGVTPAEDMMKILAYPTEEEAAAATLSQKVRLTTTMKHRIARVTQTTTDDISNSLTQLKVPLSVSGTTSRAFTQLKNAIRREGLPLIPYAGASASAAQQTTPPALPEAGSNFVSALSYGDITIAGVGTTTAVCDGEILAFGHPFFFEGATEMGANAGDSITIVDDPVFSAYKLANVAEAIGIVDQDRLAGIRGTTGQMPTLIPITSTVNALDLGTSREGESQAVVSWLVPGLTFTHMFTNIDSTFDEIGPGSSTVDWHFTGVTESGEPWELVRSNLYADDFDISFGSLFELSDMLYTLFYNPFEDIEFTGVEVTASVESEVKSYRVTDVHVSKDGLNYVDRRRIRAARGQTIYLRVFLENGDETEAPPVDLSVKIPRRARGDGTIEIGGGSNGGDDFYCFLYGDGCGSDLNKPETLQELIDALEARPKNNELRARLRMGRGQVKSEDTEILDRVIQGLRRIRVLLSDGGGAAVSEPVKG